MSRYALTPRASQDLEDIGDFVAQANARAAARLVRSLEDKCRMLAEFPEIGSRCEDLAPELRRFPVGKYVIFYRAIDDGIEVIRAVHGSRDIPSLFQS
jgi:toxin ParE1/3/4